MQVEFMKSPTSRKHYKITFDETELKKMLKMKKWLEEVIHQDIIRYGELKKVKRKKEKEEKKQT